MVIRIKQSPLVDIERTFQVRQFIVQNIQTRVVEVDFHSYCILDFFVADTNGKKECSSIDNLKRIVSKEYVRNVSS